MIRSARFRWLPLLALVAIVAACSSTPATDAVAVPSATSPEVIAAASPGAPSPAAPSQDATAWEQVLAQVGPEGTVSAETALQAFSLAFGPLPDVTVPAGPVGEIRSGSGALRWLVGNWHEISDAQRTAAIGLVPELVGIDGPPAATAPSTRIQLASFTGTAFAPARPPTYYAVLAQTMADEIESHTGLPLLLTLFAAEGRTQQTTSLADTGAYNEQGGHTGTASKCVITISAAGAAEAQVDLEDTIGHEVWHCYQAQIRGLDWYWSSTAAPGWLVEGQAEWVGDALRPAAKASSWENYTATPGRRLFARTYDALGFYAHITQAGTNTWAVLIPMLQADDNNVARYVASGATSDAFLDSWASGFFRKPNVGAAWEFEGPGLPSGAGAVRTTLKVANGTSIPFKASAYANAVYDLSSSADIVKFTVAGHARLGDPGNGQEYLLAGGAFCTMAGGCICPPGTKFVGAPPNRLSAVTLLAITGGQSGSSGVATGHSLDEFCKPDAAGDTWSLVFWSPDLGDAYPPLMVAYTCDGLKSTWKAIYLPSIDGLTRTFEMPFDASPVAHLDIHRDIPPAGLSAAVVLEYAVDFELDATADPPVIKVSGTKTESQGGQTFVFPPREFGSDAPLELKNVSLETQLKPYPQYQHPFRAQALQECGG